MGIALLSVGHLCLSLPRQRYPCISRSCQAPHGRGCKSSKRVQLSWQDAWKFELSSWHTGGSFSLQSVPRLFCSHNVETVLLNLNGDVKDFKDSDFWLWTCVALNNSEGSFRKYCAFWRLEFRISIWTLPKKCTHFQKNQNNVLNHLFPVPAKKKWWVLV